MRLRVTDKGVKEEDSKGRKNGGGEGTGQE